MWTEETLDALRSEGYRSGGARRAVVEALGRQSCCATAREILDSLQRDGRSVGIASVYRVLDLLVERGRVQKVDLGDGEARYEPADPAGDHHHHLVCDECGRIEPFEDTRLETAIRRLEHETGYALASHDVLLRGSCSDCRA
jgi:Fur family ferric uptake transcriptional regulator